MSEENNDDWFDKLINAVRQVINADPQSLKSLLSNENEWQEFASYFAEQSEASDKKLDSIVRAFKRHGDSKNHVGSKRHEKTFCEKLKINEINSEHTFKQINYLLRLASNLTASDEKNSFSYSIDVPKNNMAWLLTLIAYIYSTENEQSFQEFAKKFTELTLSLQKKTDQISSPQFATSPQVKTNNQETTQQTNIVNSNQTKKMTLILVFGQSQKTIINEIKNKSPLELNDSDYTVLGNKCEWFWYGNKENKPAEIAKNEQDNMCWLQFNINLPNAPTAVTTMLNIKDLIKIIKKQPNVLIEIKSNDTAFNLDNKVFTKL
ncbi:MAG: hypothetical protein QX190_14555 [Methylococcales bacterium]